MNQEKKQSVCVLKIIINVQCFTSLYRIPVIKIYKTLLRQTFCTLQGGSFSILLNNLYLIN